MVPHALAALYGAEIPHQTITPAAHSSHAAAFEPSEHAASMHWGVIPSILDGGESSRCACGKRETAGNVSRRSRIVRFGAADYIIPISNTFGSCASGSAAAPTTVATIAASVWLLRRLPRIWLAIHSSVGVSIFLAWAGAQLAM